MEGEVSSCLRWEYMNTDLPNFHLVRQLLLKKSLFNFCIIYVFDCFIFKIFVRLNKKMLYFRTHQMGNALEKRVSICVNV